MSTARSVDAAAKPAEISHEALIWLERTEATHPLHHELRPREPELETEPSGF